MAFVCIYIYMLVHIRSINQQRMPSLVEVRWSIAKGLYIYIYIHVPVDLDLDLYM